VVILEGSAEALGIGPEDYVELLAQEAEIHDDQESKATPGNVRSIQELREAYLKISFPSMRDVTWSTSNPNMHTCIIEQEVLFANISNDETEPYSTDPRILAEICRIRIW
jgi:hypothetical protein